ncbi:MAG: FAD:protein FMN transferase [Acidobacteriota bacterium]|nr:FAD:protein FMN transferase [Acidobacteriota bacterium]
MSPAASVAAGVPGRAAPAPAPPRPLPAAHSWEALGTGAVLKVTDRDAIDPARGIVDDELARIDRACSRFRADSDLSRVNAAPGTFVRVDPLLIEAIDVGLRAARLTKGTVDPALGGALELAGYDRDWRLLGSPVTEPSGATPPGADTGVPCVRARPRAGWRSIELDRGRGCVRVPTGVKLDLGATAKAWAADRCADAVHRRTGTGVLVSLGGDIAAAGEPPAGGWRVFVTDDHRAGLDAPGQIVTIQGGGLATSSTTVRRWLKAGAQMHHIMDPTTGRPAGGPWRTATVLAATCVDANTASTATIAGHPDAPRWLAEAGLPARLVRRDGSVLTVAGWPGEAGRDRTSHSGQAPSAVPVAEGAEER